MQGEITHIWMSRDTGNKSRYGLRTLGGIAGIVILALLLVCGAAAQFVFPGPGLASRLLGCVIVSLPMLLLALVVPGGFGGGDIKLMFGAGFFLGARLTVVAAFLGILLGGGFGALLLAAKKADRKTRFAFGPFLCIGIAAAMFFGERLADWYIGLL